MSGRRRTREGELHPFMRDEAQRASESRIRKKAAEPETLQRDVQILRLASRKIHNRHRFGPCRVQKRKTIPGVGARQPVDWF